MFLLHQVTDDFVVEIFHSLPLARTQGMTFTKDIKKWNVKAVCYAEKTSFIWSKHTKSNYNVKYFYNLK